MRDCILTGIVMYVNVCKQQDHPKPHLSALVAAAELHPPPQTQFFMQYAPQTK